MKINARGYKKKEELLRTPLAVRTGLGPATPSVTG